MLINPYIEGTMPCIYKAENSFNAAQKAYESISQYFNNIVYNYKFTLLKLSSEDANTEKINLTQYGGSSNAKKFNTNNFSHFTVNENKIENDVKFSIFKFNGTVTDTQYLINNVTKLQQKLNSQDGGSKHKKKHKKHKKHSKDDDSSSSSSSPDYYVKKKYFDPIDFYYYYPPLYIDPALSYYPSFIPSLSPLITYDTYYNDSVTHVF